MILANKFFKCSFEEYKRVLVGQMANKEIPVTLNIDEGRPLPAYVNHGRWLVRCECNGCEYAWEEGLFMCQSCWNSGHKHKLRRSTFSASRQKIEKLLSRRPLINRNWLPSETIAQLEQENTEHKSELLEVG